MGQEIVYCSRCQIQLRGRDFEKGAAFRIDALACCLKCAPEVVKSIPDEAVQQLLKEMAAPRNHSETSRIMTLASSSTTKTPHAGRRPRAASPGGMYAAAAGGGLAALVLVCVAVATSGKPPPAPAVREVVAAPTPPAPAPEPRKPSPPRPVIEEPRRPTPEQIQKRIDAELGPLDQATRELRAQEKFGAALDALEAARGRVDALEWTAAINRRRDDIHRLTSDLFASAKDAALRARKEDVAAIQDRVAKWGMPKLAADLDAALAQKPSVAPPPPSPEAVAFARCRETALHHAFARDYAAATAELKRGTEALRDPALLKVAAEDVDILRQAERALQEVRRLPSTWTKSAKLSLGYVNQDGTTGIADGAFTRMDAFRAELDLPGRGPVPLLLEEVRVGTMARQLPASRALALLCLVEGDPDTARALAGDLPERYVAWATERAAALLPGREKEAYARLCDAVKNCQDSATTAEGVLLHAGLLKDYADTRIVRRNQAFIAAGAQGGKEYVFFPEDMTAGGTFARVKNPKTESCFASAADVDAAKIAENYVEVAFSTLPDVDYRGWAYVGACCAETFAFGWQASGLAGAEPGGAAWLPVKNTLVSLKKTHALHGGAKGPTRWEWIPLPLPKAAGTGPRKLRLLTNQQGFSVGLIAVGTSKNQPRDSDLKALPAARERTPGVRPLNRAAPPPSDRTTAAEPATTVVFTLDLTGGQRPHLFSQGEVVKGPERAENQYCLSALPTKNEVNLMYMGDGGNGIFTFAGEEVFTFEYWVDAGAQKINFNFWDKTQNVQHSGQFDPLVVGKWTRVSIRLADLQGAPLRPGDRVAGLYMHAYGGSKFYVDNLQVVLPRARK